MTRATRPMHVTVWYRGIPYVLDLVRCRRALVERQVVGELDSMESLAAAAHISRSTASRFFAGRPVSLAVTLRILDALHLTFADVAEPAINHEQKGRPPTTNNRPRSDPQVTHSASVIELAQQQAQ